jgi:hypothetical protein
MEKTYYWSDMANLTHTTQVEEFGWCACEEKEYFPHDDCPRWSRCLAPTSEKSLRNIEKTLDFCLDVP